VVWGLLHEQGSHQQQHGQGRYSDAVYGVTLGSFMGCSWLPPEPCKCKMNWVHGMWH
jgi:hypothetical protein